MGCIWRLLRPKGKPIPNDVLLYPGKIFLWHALFANVGSAMNDESAFLRIYLDPNANLHFIIKFIVSVRKSFYRYI